MTIDEAIEHAKEVSRTCDDNECAAEHMQLAEWLRQARGATKAARWYTARISELEDENAKLRELVRGLHIAHVGMTNRYKGSKTGLIWEYSGDIENDTRKLESECEEECHRFDAAMRELRIEVRS